MRSLPTLLASNPSSFSKPEWQLLRAYGIANGYGPRNSPLIHALIRLMAPSFREANGNIHDVNYAKGGTEADRLKADNGFLLRLVRDSLKTGYKSLYYFCLALTFYYAVRIFGKRYFNYSKAW